MSGRSPATSKGIRRRARCWQVFVRVHGVYYSERWPLTTLPGALNAARAALEAKYRYGPAPGPKAAATLADDIDAYLPLVAQMPSYRDRAYDLEQWRQQLGHRVRATLTARDVRAVLEQWRRDGRHDGRPLSASSLNHRRTALLHLFTVLDGKAVPNVVKDVPIYSERASVQPRAVSMLSIARVIRRVRVGSKTRARLRVLQWTGLPHKLVTQIRPQDVDVRGRRLFVHARAKGQGMPAGWIPLLPRALVALRSMVTLDATGPFSKDSMRASLTRACQAAKVTPFRVYDIRHSFGTWAAGIVKDDRALKTMLRTHSIERYTDGATWARMQAAVGQLERATSHESPRGTVSPRKLPEAPESQPVNGGK